MDTQYPNVLATVIASSVVLTLTWVVTRPARKYPPGPKGLPIIGNVLDIPRGGNEWDAYAELSKQYGSDILYFSTLGASVVVLNSFEAARDLLDKKGALYSSRPRLVMLKEILDWSWNLVIMSYGKPFVAYRRIVQQEFQPSVVAESHHPIMEYEVAALISRALAEPDDIIDHIKQMAGAIIMMITYGHQVTSAADKFVNIAETVRATAATRPGMEIVDVFPILRYLPAWFPGAGFHEYARVNRVWADQMRNLPYEMVKGQMAAGTARPCMNTRLLTQQDFDTAGQDREEFIKNCCGVVYSGADTTASAITNFVLAMTLYPEVQKRAQRELDQVVGRGRLPSFHDRESLPYVSNVVKEALRWKAVSPMGVPHATIDADEHKGFYIPKGTTVFANISHILNDESVYTKPDAFNPERYSPTAKKPEGEPSPTRAAFGFGRRICPGRFFAEDSVWLAIASLLHSFVISVPQGTTASISQIKWNSGLVSRPSPFPFELTPRFDGIDDIVNLHGGIAQ